MSIPSNASRRHVRTTDGLELAVTEYAGPPDDPHAPVIVCVHGYPDNQTVWTPVAQRLASRFRVVTYDVRGCGDSDAPRDRSGYLIPRLNADLAAVIDAVSPDAPVHLLAHDWGSIQTWSAVGGNVPATRIASYTSISGPDLDQAAVWLRGLAKNGLAGARKRLAQLAESYYVFLFQTPRLPEAVWRSGVLEKLLAREFRGVDAEVREVVTHRERDRINGIELYRANILGRLGRPAPRPVEVPVQVIAPTRDIYVSMPLATEAPRPYVADLTVVTVEGRHWVVLERPDHIAELVAGFATAHAAGGGVGEATDGPAGHENGTQA